MIESRICPVCRTPLPSGAPDGPCTRCQPTRGLSELAALAAEGARLAPEPASGPFRVLSPAELAPLFPQLEITGLLGQGGMGVVYRARQPALDRSVALKVLPLEAGRAPAFAERFGREARALAHLSHSHIVTLYDFGQVGELYYFLMEYVDGLNLRQLLRAGRLQPPEALKIVAQICDALQYAHEEGVVHRDVKPENVLLDRRGRVKIADFGLAKLLAAPRSDVALTGSRQAMGTLHYMAPEQWERPQTVDHRADIYSVGVVFYELLTGELPLGRFALPSEKAVIDGRLDDVVLRALEKEPDRRYQQMSSLKADVDTIARVNPSPTVVELAASPAPHAAAYPVATPILSALPAPDESVFEPAWKRTKWPAIGLIATGGVDILLSLIGGALATVGELPVSLRVAPGSLSATGLLILGAGLCMYTFKWRRLALVGSIVAVIPCSTAWLLSLPMGIWALVVLNRPEVKAAFAERRRNVHFADRKTKSR